MHTYAHTHANTHIHTYASVHTAFLHSSVMDVLYRDSLVRSSEMTDALSANSTSLASGHGIKGHASSPSSALSPELANYAIAGVVYAVQYASMFWNRNRWFSALFSALLAVSGRG